MLRATGVLCRNSLPAVQPRQRIGERNSDADMHKDGRLPKVSFGQNSPSAVETRLLCMRTVRNMTKNGKLLRFSALVAAGNGNGSVGIGQATHEASIDAIAKASRLAIRNMVYFDRWEDRTIFHDDMAKFKASRLYVRPSPPRTGRRCHPAVAEMCRCMGIADISGKVHGSSHPMNVAKAFLTILQRQKTPEQVARDSGMKIVDVVKIYKEGCNQEPSVNGY